MHPMFSDCVGRTGLAKNRQTQEIGELRSVLFSMAWKLAASKYNSRGFHRMLTTPRLPMSLQRAIAGNRGWSVWQQHEETGL